MIGKKKLAETKAELVALLGRLPGRSPRGWLVKEVELARRDGNRDVQTLEALCAAQGVDLVGLEPAPPTRAVHRAVREVSPHLDEDRSLAPDVAALSARIADETIVAAARQLAPGLV